MFPGFALLRQISTGGSILCYHGVATAGIGSAGVANVTIDELSDTCAALRRCTEVVPLSTLVNRHARGASTRGLAAITFDDAYKSLDSALPSLVERHGMPVTIFVTTNASAAGSAFWWDRIDDLFERVAQARWRSFEDAIGLPNAFRVGQQPEMGPLRPLRQWLLSEHRGRWPLSAEPFLQELEAETGFRTQQRAMTMPELDLTTRSDLVEIGVHTRTHPVLPLLADDELGDEIATAHAVLRERFARAVPILAAPFGLVDARTVGQARAHGMTVTLGLHGVPLPARAGDGPLPRFAITRGVPRWRLGLHVSGVVQSLRALAGWSPPVYPTLPSATT